MNTLTRNQVREVDRIAIEELGLPGVVLMENAGRAVTVQVLEMLGGRGSVAILCGGGNNGGDGYVIARHLHNASVNVTIYAAKEPGELDGDAAIHAAVAQRMGLPIQPITMIEQIATHAPAWADCGVIIDALLGTGFRGTVRSPMSDIIRRCNQARAGKTKVVAVDLPSGMDCDTGEAGDPTIIADVTVTFVAAKAGFANPAAEPFLGRVVLGDIGTPPGLINRVRQTVVS